MVAEKMRLVGFALILLLPLCSPQQCPRQGEVLKADPNNECRYLHCYNGRGRWFYCSQDRVFNEREQCCTTPRRANDRYSMDDDPNNSRNANNNNRNDNNNNFDNGNANFDYHW